MGDKHVGRTVRDDGPRADPSVGPSTAVYYVELDGQLGWWTDRLASLIGYTSEELSGKQIDDVLAPEGRRILTELLDAEEPVRRWTGKFGLLGSDDTTVPCHHEIGVVTDGDGEPAGLIAVATASAGEESPVPLGTYRRIIETLGAVVGDLGSAGTQAEVERTVCEGLVDSELYTAAWIGHRDRDGSVTPTVSAGPETDGGAKAGALEGAEEYPPAEETLDAGETRVVRADFSELPESFRSFATANGVASVVSVPVTSGATTDRVLVACSDRVAGFDEVETWAFEQLGRIVGFAVNAAHTERIVLSEPVVELELRLTSTKLPLVGLASDGDVTGRMEWMTRETDGTVVQYFTVDGADTDTVVASVTSADHVRSCTPVGEGDTDLYEIRLAESIVVELLDAGVETREIRVDERGATIVATSPPDTDVRNVLQQVRSVYSGVELVAKRTLDAPDSEEEAPRLRGVSMTDRQLDAIDAAFEAGYFEWPRESTAEEVAEDLGISAATLHYHLRRAEQALVGAFLDAERP